MGLNAIQSYCAAILNNLESPYLQPMRTIITSPQLEDVASEPRMYIWAATGNQRRQTAPRTKTFGSGGYKVDVWQVAGTIITIMEMDDDHLDSAFPLLIDQIKATLNLTPCPLVITDPDTGNQTQVIAVGENIATAYARVITTGPQGGAVIRFVCDLRMEVQEALSFDAGSYYNEPST